MSDKAQSFKGLLLEIVALENVPPAALASASRLIEADTRFNGWCAQGKMNDSFPGVDSEEIILLHEDVFQLCRAAVDAYLADKDADRLKSILDIGTGMLNDYVDRRPLTR